MTELRTIIDIGRLECLRLLALCSPPGAVAEIGVYKGGSLRVISKSRPESKAFGCDTFSGLPKEKHCELEFHDPGEFADTSLATVREYLSDCPNVKLVPGMFPESATPEMEALRFAFVHIDTDFYLSVKSALDFFWPRMLPGGIVVFDDYDSSRCPGVKRAIEEAGLTVHLSRSIQAFARK